MKTSNRILHVAVLASLAGISNLAVADWGSQTYAAVPMAACPQNVTPLFTTGGQYLDPNNGVLLDSYSMLTRWQGSIAPVSYDLGIYTGLSTPAPRTSYQAGFQPENQQFASPGTQLVCNSGVMSGAIFTNTWFLRHQDILGGGYNSMFGYAWSNQNQFRAFEDTSGNPTDLIIRINAAFTLGDVHETPLASGETKRLYPELQQVLFVYLKDISHPSLHEIGIIGMMAQNLEHFSDQAPQSTFRNPADGSVGVDYYKEDPNTHVVVTVGAFYSAGNMTASSPYTTVLSSSPSVDLIQGQDRPLLPYQLQISPKNLMNMIDKIEGVGGLHPLDCKKLPAGGCPERGYSRNPHDYVIRYAGLLSEVGISDRNFDPLEPAPYNPDGNKDQISGAVRFQDFGVLRASPASSFLGGVVGLLNYYYDQILSYDQLLANGTVLHFNRPPDLAGQNYYVNMFQNLSQADVIQKSRDIGAAFYASAEYASHGIANDVFVESLYKALLGRDSDAGGKAYWIAQLNGGMSRATVVSGFTYSSEFPARTILAVY